MAAWFRKTTVYTYSTCVDALKQQVDAMIDRTINDLYQSSEHGDYSFRFPAPVSIAVTRDSYVDGIGPAVYFASVARVLHPRPYTIFPNGDHGYWYVVCLLQGPAATAAAAAPARPIGARLAHAAIRHAQHTDEVCAITQEPLRTHTGAFAVAQCGHVFSEVAADLASCPLCMSPAAWTIVVESTAVPAVV
jgi:hypothetical protein